MSTRYRLAFPLAALIATSAAFAQEVRQLDRIPTPDAAMTLPPGARAVVSLRPVPAALVEAAVKRLAASWNTPALGARLAPNFYGREQLLDTLQARVPRDAVLRVLGVQGVQTLEQYVQADDSGQAMLVSRVSATVRTQVEFDDPAAGFQRREGTNEIVLLVKEPAP
jgi:hypothetical protein